MKTETDSKFPNTSSCIKNSQSGHCTVLFRPENPSFTANIFPVMVSSFWRAILFLYWDQVSLLCTMEQNFPELLEKLHMECLLQCLLNYKAICIEHFAIVLLPFWVNNTSAVKLALPSQPHVCHNISRIWLLPLQIITDPIRDKVLNIHEYQRLMWLSRKLKSTFCSRIRENSPKEGYIYLEKNLGAQIRKGIFQKLH